MIVVLRAVGGADDAGDGLEDDEHSAFVPFMVGAGFFDEFPNAFLAAGGPDFFAFFGAHLLEVAVLVGGGEGVGKPKPFGSRGVAVAAIAQ